MYRRAHACIHSQIPGLSGPPGLSVTPSLSVRWNRDFIFSGNCFASDVTLSGYSCAPQYITLRFVQITAGVYAARPWCPSLTGKRRVCMPGRPVLRPRPGGGRLHGLSGVPECAGDREKKLPSAPKQMSGTQHTFRSPAPMVNPSFLYVVGCTGATSGELNAGRT